MLKFIYFLEVSLCFYRPNSLLFLIARSDSILCNYYNFIIIRIILFYIISPMFNLILGKGASLNLAAWESLCNVTSSWRSLKDCPLIYWEVISGNDRSTAPRWPIPAWGRPMIALIVVAVSSVVQPALISSLLWRQQSDSVATWVFFCYIGHQGSSSKVASNFHFLISEFWFDMLC